VCLSVCVCPSQRRRLHATDPHTRHRQSAPTHNSHTSPTDIYLIYIYIYMYLSIYLYIYIQEQTCNRAATELQQSCNRAATELQHSTRDKSIEVCAQEQPLVSRSRVAVYAQQQEAYTHRRIHLHAYTHTLFLSRRYSVCVHAWKPLVDAHTLFLSRRYVSLLDS